MKFRQISTGLALSFVCVAAAGSTALADSHLTDPNALVWKHDLEYQHDDQEHVFGAVLAGAGDINADGVDDFIVSGWENGGAVHVFYGEQTGVRASPNWSQDSPQDAAEFGRAVAGAGDVNGDGFDDFIVGAPMYSVEGEQKEGAVFLYFGNRAGLPAQPDQEILGDQQEGQFGAAIAAAGDVNNDGFADVVIGAPTQRVEGAPSGVAHVYLGSENGLQTTIHFTIDAPKRQSNFGWSVAGVGDVNGDSFDDIIIGAPTYTDGEPSEGGVFVYPGSEQGVQNRPIWQAESNSDNAFLGFAVESAGDINADGNPDVVAGAAGYSNEQTQEGAAFVWMGNGSGFDADYAWMIESDREEGFLGADVSGGGDVNGDGYDDVLIANAHLGLVSFGGELYLGGPTGLAPEFEWQALFEGASTIGDTAHIVGDLDGDGLDDMILGAPALFAIYLYYGANCFDADMDGYQAYNEMVCNGGTDCHDLYERANPGVEVESCDGLDNDCNGTTDEGCDDDGDDYCDQSMEAFIANGLPEICPLGVDDCNDEDPNHNPGSPELCDFEDNDCNNQIDEEPKVCGEQICHLGGCFDACETEADCADGQGCYDGRCANDPCDGVVCREATEECFMGTCQIACEIEARCRVLDKQCIDGRCANDPCDGVLCSTGQVCSNGACVAEGTNPDAGMGDAGMGDAGNVGQPSSGGDSGGCSTTGGDAGGAAWLAALVLGGALWRRRG